MKRVIICMEKTEKLGKSQDIREWWFCLLNHALRSTFTLRSDIYLISVNWAGNWANCLCGNPQCTTLLLGTSRYWHWAPVSHRDSGCSSDRPAKVPRGQSWCPWQHRWLNSTGRSGTGGHSLLDLHFQAPSTCMWRFHLAWRGLLASGSL